MFVSSEDTFHKLPWILDIFLCLAFLSASQFYEPLQFPMRNICFPERNTAQTHSQSSCSVNTYSLIDRLKGSPYEDCPSLVCFTTFSNLLVFLPVFLTCHHTFFCHCRYLWEGEIIQKQLYFQSRML